MLQELPENIRGYFKPVYEDVVWLQCKWDFYLALYDNRENARLIYGLAQTSFMIIEDSLRSDMVMTICRLGDPAKSRKLDRLSFEILIRKSGITNLDKLLNEFIVASKPIRDNRNKVIAHTDLNTAINPLMQRHCEINKNDINRTLEVAWRIINSVYNQFVPDKMILPKVKVMSGADMLIYWLQLAEKHKDDF